MYLFSKGSSVPLWLPSSRYPTVSDYVKKRLSEQAGTLAFQVLPKQSVEWPVFLLPKSYIKGEVLLEFDMAWFVLSTAFIKPSPHSLKTEVFFCQMRALCQFPFAGPIPSSGTSTVWAHTRKGPSPTCSSVVGFSPTSVMWGLLQQ